MARSKSKSRPSQKANAKTKNGQDLRTEGLMASPEFNCQSAQGQPGQISESNCSTHNECVSLETHTKCNVAVGLLENVSNQALGSESTSGSIAKNTEAEATNFPTDEFENLMNHQEIEAALERVDLWLSESSSEPENLEKIATCIESEKHSEVCEKPDYRLKPDFAAEVCQDQKSQADHCASNQLIVLESEKQPSLVKHETMEVDSVCQRLESTAAAIESRLEQLLTGFESSMNSRLSQMLQVFDQLPKQLVEMQVDMKSNARESIVNSKSAVPSEASWESRKRQMLSEFGMTNEEIEQLVPDQKDAKSVNEKSKMAPKVESVALEALHTSIETLDKIDSGIRSEEIDRLKEQLTAQLREAEVELSINRAKLCKEWATLEQRASELSQRESALKSKYKDAETTTKHGLLDRITRHLSRRS